MRKFAIAAAALLPLMVGACASGAPKSLQNLATFTKADADNAAAMAKANGSADATARLPCYQGWAALAGGVGSTKDGSIGVFTGTEAGLEAEELINTTACRGIAADAIVTAMRIGNAALAAPVAAAGAAVLLSPVKPIP